MRNKLSILTGLVIGAGLGGGGTHLYTENYVEPKIVEKVVEMEVEAEPEQYTIWSTVYKTPTHLQKEILKLTTDKKMIKKYALNRWLETDEGQLALAEIYPFTFHYEKISADWKGTPEQFRKKTIYYLNFVKWKKDRENWDENDWSLIKTKFEISLENAKKEALNE